MPRPRVGLCGEAAQTLRRLLEPDLGGVARRQRRRGRRALRASRRCAALSPVMQSHIDTLNLIRDALPTAVLVGDSTQLVYAGNLGFAAATPGSWFNSATGYGTLGYALPASTGAGLAAPERPIVCLVGDGGLQFSLGELAVLREVDAWTAIIVWNNRGYGEIRSSMLALGIVRKVSTYSRPISRCWRRPMAMRHRLIETPRRSAMRCREFGRRRQIIVLELAAD